MMTLTVTNPGKGQALLYIEDPDELLVNGIGPARQLLMQAYISIEGEVGQLECTEVPKIALVLLRNFLTSQLGANNDSKARRLLIQALMQMDDEDEAKRFQVPIQSLPVLLK